MLLAGNLMAQHWNLSVDTRKAGVRTRKDYYKLSYDTQLTEEIDPDLFNKVARRLGGTIKKKEDADK